MPGNSGLFGRGGRYRCDYSLLSKAFDLVPHDRLFTKMEASGLDSRVREFVVGRTQRVRLGGQLSKEVKVISGGPQGSVLDPRLF